jgi:polyhydroxybutyrate depolymerase
MRRRRVLRVLGLLMLVLFLGIIGLAATVGSAMSPMAACRRPTQGPPQAGDSVRTLSSGGMERCYLLHVPPGHDPSRSSPLVLSLHGFAGTPRNQEQMSRWNEVADAEDVVVVYPQGTSFPLRWNMSAVQAPGSVDDLQFIRDLITELEGLMAIDPTRVYVNGMSNGGGMTARIACDMADTVAAVGIVAGAVLDAPGMCSPARPIPLIAFHGSADPIVSYQGGPFEPAAWTRLIRMPRQHFELQAVGTWVRGWAEWNGCNPSPEAIAPIGNVSGIRYTGCRDDAEVVLYTIEGGGHTWPGGSPLPAWLVGVTNTDVDASATMWEFYRAHPLPPAP